MSLVVMNEIGFDIQHSEYGNLVVPLIDGKSLISILKQIELPFCKKEKAEKIAGGYDGLPVSLVCPPSRHFYGEGTQKVGGKTALLICECLCEGCWDFVCEITITDKKVIWKNFEQIHRENWNYNELGVLVFDRKRYENALKELENK